ncbi:MAG: PepSY domain-containing protein [Propionibacteriales bacterium]|nr:PepSY domain-containing protein [Propionibacteriales bacterium]
MQTDTSTTAEHVSRANGPRQPVRAMLVRLHFCAGVFVAPFILVAAVSGLLYALSPSLEQLVHHDQLHTESRGEPLRLADQIAAARTTEPDLPLLAVRPAAETGTATRVLFDGGQIEESRREAVFVDPVTGAVSGELPVYGSSGALPLRTWVEQLHSGLHLGEPGRIYSELAASWLWVIGLAGLALWWTGPRRARRLRPSRVGGRRSRTLSWHGAVGTWALLGMLMLSATGLTWSRFAGANVTDLREALGWTTPAVAADVPPNADPHAAHRGGGATEPPQTSDGPGIGYESAADVGADQGLAGPVEITGPVGATGAYVVQELDRSWPTRTDAVSVDPADGTVVDVVRFADFPLAAQLARWGIDVHTGLLFGRYNQVTLALLALVLVAMVVWGYRMWWVRRPTLDHRLRLGRPPRRGAWRRVRPMTLVGGIALAVAVGWILPVLGASLLLFVLVDSLVGLLPGRRSVQTGGPPAKLRLGDPQLTGPRAR